MDIYRRLIQYYRQADVYTRWALIVLVLAIGLRFLITFFVHAAGDSYTHLSTARYIAQTWTLPLFEPIYRPFFYYPPLFHIVTAGLYTLFSHFGEQIATKAMDFVAPLFGSAMLIVFYVFVRRSTPRHVALYSIIFLSFIPLHLYYSTIAHVDIAAAFMPLLALTLLQTRRFWPSALANGLGMMTKYTNLFAFPALAVQVWQQTRSIGAFLKRSASFFGIGLIIGIPLYVRNYLYLGTPMWPFLNNVFSALGMTPLLVETRPVPSLLHFADPTLLLRAYLDVFGVPLGLPIHLSTLPAPIITLWLLGTLLFCIPFIVGLGAKKPKALMQILWALIASYLIMITYYIYDFGDLFMRLVLPLFPAVAVIWGYGLDSIVHRSGRRRQAILFVVLALVCAGFVGVEFAKAHIAAAPYARLESDYQWIRDHLPPDAVFDRHSTYLLYHTNKQMSSLLCRIEDYPPDNLYHYNDPFVEQDNPLSLYKNWTLVYENPSTQVTVFKKTPVT